MKKAQLTLMIITGIILLFAIGLVIWLGGQAAQRRTAPEAEQQRLRQLAVQPVKDYIQSCLDITTATGLELLGKQGGVLYQSQGGLTKDVRPEEEGSRYAVYDGLNVSYVIAAPAEDVGQLFFVQPPKYPFLTFPYVFRNDDPNTNEVIATQYIGYVGMPQLAPLFKPGTESVQEQLESYVNHNLPRCAKWETFEPQGLAIIAGEPNTSVFIAENLTQIATEQFFTVTVNWPVLITDLTTQGETALQQFSLSYPVHLAKFYLFVKGIVDSDVSDSRFDPPAVATSANPVLVIRDVHENPDGTADSIIVIQDVESWLRGKPLEFRVLRKNRIPALVWINQTDLDAYRFVPTATCNLDAENIFLQGDELLIKWGTPADWHASLVAIDPDEDIVTFRTLPKAPAKINVNHAGEDFRLYVYATDGSVDEAQQDYQILNLRTADCPTP